MILEQKEFLDKLERINETYFSDPSRWLSVPRGSSIVRQGEPTKRLYLIRSGEVVAYRHFVDEVPETASASHRIYEVFRAGTGAYVGVQSYFSQWYRSSSDIVAQTDVELAYIDDTIQVVDEERYGSRLEQFIPIILHELALRNMRVFTRSVEKEEALRALHRSEMAATLGQLSAGIAHELNNSIGVLARKTDFVSDFIEERLMNREDENPEHLYQLGKKNDIAVTPTELLRKTARQYEKQFALDQRNARILAKIAPDGDAEQKFNGGVIDSLEKYSPYWELGNDIRDMKMAARHAANIVRSVKLLGGGNTKRETGINVQDSIAEAVALLKSRLRGVSFDAELPERDNFPTITADMTELVQIWINLLSNACDSMNLGGTTNPSIKITCHYIPDENFTDALSRENCGGHIRVSVTDNGPGVPSAIQEKIFRPNFTTKKKGLSFGLGLGLAIVRRIVDSYGGTITLDSIPGKTTFTVTIPIDYSHGNH